MPTPFVRPSLTTDLQTRYSKQKVGGAFDVKKILKQPGSVPVTGTTIDAVSAQAQSFQSPVGFEVSVKQGGTTQLRDAQGTKSKQLSRYMKGFSNQRYKP